MVAEEQLAGLFGSMSSGSAVCSPPRSGLTRRIGADAWICIRPYPELKAGIEDISHLAPRDGVHHTDTDEALEYMREASNHEALPTSQ